MVCLPPCLFVLVFGCCFGLIERFDTFWEMSGTLSWPVFSSRSRVFDRRRCSGAQKNSALRTHLGAMSRDLPPLCCSRADSPLFFGLCDIHTFWVQTRRPSVSCVVDLSPTHSSSRTTTPETRLSVA